MTLDEGVSRIFWTGSAIYTAVVVSGVPKGCLGLQTSPPSRPKFRSFDKAEPNSEVLTKLSRIPSSVENTSITT
jgi:hypothetical protein